MLSLGIPKGDPGSVPIDDTAGVGDTTKVWSADKTATEFSDVKSAIDSAPSEESGAELIAELSASAGLDEIFLESLGWYIDNLPQDESGQDIVDALTLEADRLAALYEIWEAERSA